MHIEPGAPPEATDALNLELKALASGLGLENVESACERQAGRPELWIF
jgi:hypothetical protein